MSGAARIRVAPLVFLGLLLTTVALGCSAHSASARAAAVPKAGATPSASDSTALAPPPPAPIPVDADDPNHGPVDATVTIVAFIDLQDPFTARVLPTLEAIQRRYADGVRVVYKHYPLPFHKDAYGAAQVVQAVFEARGSDAAFDFVRRAVTDQKALDRDSLARVAEQVGVPKQELQARLDSGKPQAEVDADVRLVKELEVIGTPSFRINGTILNGSQPLEAFVNVIENEIAEARTLSARGVAARDVYAYRVANNVALQRAEQQRKPAVDDAEPDDTTVHNLPIGHSPVRGPADALITIVMFSDFQCPFCKRVRTTLDELMRRHPGDVRLVFKHQPLPFHERAMAAATFAEEARLEKGNQGFWLAHDALFARAPKLEDADLLALATTLKLDAARVRAALAKNAHKATIDADADLADDVQASGVPHFFINGRRLVGAQPLDEFERVVGEELTKTRALVQRGVARARVYDEIMKGAAAAPLPEQKALPAPTKDNPSRGRPDAPVVIQMFSDFECPFCRRVTPTIAGLEKEFPTQLRIVWRNLPLEFHQHARLAAAAALEARAQRGDRGFWQMHDLLFGVASKRPTSPPSGEGEPSPSELDRAQLERYAATLGLDMARFRKALDENVHEPEITRDVALAQANGISGTPAFVINGYFVGGAQSATRFRKVIRRALADTKAAKR